LPRLPELHIGEVLVRVQMSVRYAYLVLIALC
jgi:hypothetical protein